MARGADSIGAGPPAKKASVRDDLGLCTHVRWNENESNAIFSNSWHLIDSHLTSLRPRTFLPPPTEAT